MYHRPVVSSRPNAPADREKSTLLPACPCLPLLPVIQARTAHRQQGLVEIATELPSVPDALDMPAFQGVAGGVVIRRDIDPGRLADDPRPGETDPAGADGELVRRAAEEGGDRSGVGIVVVDDDIETAGIDVLPDRHRAFRHLDHAQRSLLDADAAGGMDVGEERALLPLRQLAGLDKFLALGRADGAVAEIGVEHGDDDVDAVDLGMEGHVAGIPAGFFLRDRQPLGKAGVIQGIAAGDLVVEEFDRTGVEDVLQVPLVFEWKVVAAGLADPGEFAVEIGDPQVLAAVAGGVRAGDGPVLVGQRAGVGVGQFEGIDYPTVLLAGIRRDDKTRRRLPALLLVGPEIDHGVERFGDPFEHHRALARHVLDDPVHLPFVVLEDVVAQGVIHLFNPGPGLVGEVGAGAGEAGESVPGQAQIFFRPLGQQPPDFVAIEIPRDLDLQFLGFGGVLFAPDLPGPEGAEAFGRQDDLVGRPEHLRAQGGEKVEVVATGAERRFVDDPVDRAVLQVVECGEAQPVGADLDQLLRHLRTFPDLALDGGRTLRRDDRVVAVGDHQAVVGQADGLGPAGTALRDQRDHRHPQLRHGVDVAGDLLGSAGIFLDRVRSRGKDVEMDRDTLGLGDLHEAFGLGVAFGPAGAAVAELLAVAGLLADDHDRGGVGLVLDAADDRGLGADHRRVDIGVALAAELGVVFVDVFEDVLEAEPLGAADDPHPFHRRQLFLDPFLEKTDRLMKFADLAGKFLDGMVVDGLLEAVAGGFEAVQVAPVAEILDLQQVVDPLFDFMQLF